ncbi:MAG: hypothetical protein JO144_08640 [Actinobacteria bacterium]|nr:hypothetical protein [Actinomycetota bacterium]
MTSPARGVPGTARHEQARAESAGPSSEVPASAAPALGALVAVPGLSVATTGRTARPAASSSAPTIRRNFVLTKSYRPKTTGVIARPKFAPQMTDELDPSQVYRVTGFDLSGNMVLTDEQTGVEYLVARELHSSFDVVEAPTGASAPDTSPPAPATATPVPSSSSSSSSSMSPSSTSSNSNSNSSSSPSSSSSSSSSVVGYPDSATAGWEEQRHEYGCWLAAVAVLTNSRQQEIQKSLGWGDDAFYSISDGDLIEFCQMLKWPVEQIALTELARVHASLQAGNLVMIGVPAHMMVVFAIAADDSFVRVWDPRTRKIHQLATATLASKAESFFVRKGT